MGLLDKTEGNTFITFRKRAKPKVLRHGKFHQNLLNQLFHIARKQLPIPDLSGALVVEVHDFSVLWQNRAPSFVSAPKPLPTPEKADAAKFPAHKRGQLLVKQSCYLCRKEGRSYMNIAVGCTGGRHRSVAIAEEIGQLVEKARFNCKVVHRELSQGGL